MRCRAQSCHDMGSRPFVCDVTSNNKLTQRNQTKSANNILHMNAQHSCPTSSQPHNTRHRCIVTHSSTGSSPNLCIVRIGLDWAVFCPLQHSIGYMGDGFYRSKDPTNSIKVLKEKTTNVLHKNKTDTRGDQKVLGLT